MAPVWFITGVSSGLGTEIALKALGAGQRVIGTVRSRTKAAEKVAAIENKGGKVLELDVTDAAAAPAVFKKAESLYGQVDVMVNNAGYSLLGAVEDLGCALSLSFAFVSFLTTASNNLLQGAMLFADSCAATQRRGGQSTNGHEFLRSSKTDSSGITWLSCPQEWYHSEYYQCCWN